MSLALVIGGGPAGLMAADVLASNGHDVLLTEAMPSIGRKFLMAGKSGLNITKMENPVQFLRAYGADATDLAPFIARFGPSDVENWASDLGQSTFVGSTGRVFPVAMKASPLLRAWLKRLAALGVEFRTKWRWIGWENSKAIFQTPHGTEGINADVQVMALGGASWARLGSDGKWAKEFDGLTQPFKPANIGFEVRWSDHMATHYGAAIKGCRLLSGNLRSRGEFVISAHGLEGGGIYEISRAVREGAALSIDFAPDVTLQNVRKRIERVGRATSLANMLRKGFNLTPAKRALFNEFARQDPAPLAEKIKALRLPGLKPRPLDEAISTAGGLRFEVLDETLMMRARPGIFCAGEMLDWEAPTGGYLLTACLATGRAAGEGAVAFLENRGVENNEGAPTSAP